MDFLDLARTRRSVRAYRHEPVPREKIERCLEAARLAPSASNSQPWRFVVADRPEILALVAAAARGPAAGFNAFVSSAPAVAVVVGEPAGAVVALGGLLRGVRYAAYDIGMAVEHFCLQAAEDGLGTCIIGWFDEKAVKKALGIPARKRVELLIALGYPAADEARPKERKTMDEIRSYNHY
ncbi:MAG: nitroreductase family protein [Patescibacteria group bacterium]